MSARCTYRLFCYSALISASVVIFLPACGSHAESNSPQEEEEEPVSTALPPPIPPYNSMVIGGAPGDPNPAGRWGHARKNAAPPGINPWQKEQYEQAQALGYVQGSQPAVHKSGVTRYNRKKVQGGLNFYVSGHAPTAILMDMDGKVLHTWTYPFEKAWKKFKGDGDPVHELFWRRAHLYPNGDVLAIFEGLGMIRIDKDSKLIWKSALRQHHDIKATKTGEIYTLTRSKDLREKINPNETILADYITVLSSEGEIKKQVSVVDAIQKNPSAMRLWPPTLFNRGDVLHTNTVYLLSDKDASVHPAFTAGQVLVSSYTLNALFLIDLDKDEVVWSFRDDFINQHDAQILPSGHLLLLDNHGIADRKGGSRILEYKLPEMKLAWTYEGTEKERFGTPSCGTVQRLKNGNTLITETDNGRAFEVLRDGTIVWEFISPHRAGEHNELVASLFELRRFPRAHAAWLKK